MTISFKSEVRPGSIKQKEAGILGTATVTINSDSNVIATLYDIYIRQGPNGPFVAFPQKKGTDDKYYSYYRLYPEDKDTYGKLCNSILAKLASDNSPPRQSPPAPAKKQAASAGVPAQSKTVSMPAPSSDEVSLQDISFS